MKALGAMLPWAIVVAVTGGAIWWLLARELAAGRWVLGGFLVAHGLVHLLFTLPAPQRDAPWPFSMREAWPVTVLGLDAGPVRTVGLVLIAGTILAFVLGALSTTGIFVPPSWWPWLVGVGAGVSACTLLFFFDPQLLLGLGIDAVLLWGVASGVWSP